MLYSIHHMTLKLQFFGMKMSRFCHIYTLALLYKFTSVYMWAGQVEDEIPATRGNVCIFTSICSVKFLYHDQ